MPKKFDAYDKEDRIFGLPEGVFDIDGDLWAYRFMANGQNWFILSSHIHISYARFLFYKRNLLYPPPYKTNENIQIIWRKILSKFCSLVIPTAVVGVVAVIAREKGCMDVAYYVPYRGCYWFTITLFEIYVIYEFLNVLLSSLNRTLVLTTLIFLLFLLKLVIYKYCFSIFGIEIFSFIDFNRLILYLPWFLIGVIAKLQIETFTKVIKSNWLISCVLVLYICIFVFDLRACLSNGVADVFDYLKTFLAILILFRIFSMSQNFFSSNNRFGKILVYVGQRTLPIYLVHYFFIEGMRNLSPAFRALVQQNWFFELIIISAIAIMICGACLAVEKVLQKFPLLHSLAFGFKLKKKA